MIYTLLSGPYGLLIKLVLALAAVAGLFGFGYYEGHKHAIAAAKAEIVDHILIQTRAVPGETKVLTQTVTKIVTVHDKVYIDVPKLIPDDRACDVPAAAVGLLNSNRGTLPAPR